MSTSQSCIARAEEAERLAALVSYERDRVRLTRQAAEWRERAAETEASGDAEIQAQPRSWLDRLSGAWRRRAG